MLPFQLNDPVALPAEKRGVAERISARLLDPSRGTGRKPVLTLPNGEEIELPAELLLLLRDVTAVLARGEPVSVVPLHREMTTQEAADLLNVSRQHLVELLEAGEIPFTRPGRGKHRRVLAADVLAYKKRRDGERRVALRELTHLSEDAGDYFGDAPESFKRLDEHDE
jgi:excisionase family DNA binding protein